jgi:ABC-type multidrug transport system fused ATPase/permease subunit
MHRWRPLNSLLKNKNRTSIVTTYIAQISPNYAPAITNSVIGQSLAMFVFITWLLWPTFVHRIIYEREEKLFHMMRISGMKPGTYWFSNFLFDGLVQLIWSLLFLIIPLAFGAPAITNAGGGIHLLILLVTTYAIMGMTIFYSALFTSRRTAVVIGYLIVIIASGLAPLFSLPWPMFIIPQIAYIRVLDLGIRYGSGAFDANSDMGIAIMMLIVIPTILLVIGVYLNTIKYRSLLIFESCCNKNKRRVANVGDDIALVDDAKYQSYGGVGRDRSRSNSGNNSPGFTADLLEDIDVRTERKRILDRSWDKASPPAIVIRNLVKSFAKSGTEKNDKLAVNHICLGIDQGECFGLLGPNGAGKTTTLSILSGLLDQTSGTLRVGPYDTRTEIDLVYTILGICPQFDTVWEDLSIKEHFLFYARLKGAEREYETALAQRQAEMVDLDGDAFNKNASSLSGKT